MKEVSEIRNYRAPFYAIMYHEFRNIALLHGYALSLHGSMANDMDMIAVPWVQHVRPVEDLVEAIHKSMGKTIWHDTIIQKAKEQPHNRVTYSLVIMGDWHIDLSIMKPL
jgi:hypothetical protein